MLVVARSDAAVSPLRGPTLQAAEHALDGVSTTVEDGAEAAFADAGALRRDVWNSALRLDLLANGVGVVGAVRHDQGLARQALQQSLGRPTVRCLAAGEREGDRTAHPIGQAVDLGELPEAKRGFVLLPRHWVVERFFAWATHCRRLVKNYERYASTLTGFQAIAFVGYMLKHVADLSQMHNTL